MRTLSIFLAVFLWTQPAVAQTGAADISAQPAGTSTKYRIKTLNTKDQRLHGVGLQWS